MTTPATIGASNRRTVSSGTEARVGPHEAGELIGSTLGGANFAVTAAANGTDKALGGKYTEWRFSTLPTTINFFPAYTKPGSYPFKLAFLDAKTGLQLPDTSGYGHFTLDITITP